MIYHDRRAIEGSLITAESRVEYPELPIQNEYRTPRVSPIASGTIQTGPTPASAFRNVVEKRAVANRDAASIAEDCTAKATATSTVKGASISSIRPAEPHQARLIRRQSRRRRPTSAAKSTVAAADNNHCVGPARAATPSEASVSSIAAAFRTASTTTAIASVSAVKTSGRWEWIAWVHPPAASATTAGAGGVKSYPAGIGTPPAPAALIPTDKVLRVTDSSTAPAAKTELSMAICIQRRGFSKRSRPDGTSPSGTGE